MKKNIKSFLATSLAIATLGLTSLTISMPSIADTSATATTPVIAQQAQKPTLAPMIKQVLPSVVSIEVKGVRATTEDNGDFDQFQNMLPPEFQQFFNGLGKPQGKAVERQFRSAGSGVIIDADKGYIVTNNHVVQDGKTFRVKLYNNREYSAKIVGVDPETDLAVLKLENFSDLKAIKFSNSDTAEVGDFVVAIGNPFDIGLTVTQGIVSALNRSTQLSFFDSYIQTDAAINSGNSGGALVDLNGNLVGINTAILSKSGGSVGIGYAIPANIVKNVSDQLIKYGKVSRGQIGIRGNDITNQLANTLKLPVTEGAFITEVLQDSPAEKAGLKAGDIVVQMNDTKIVSFQQFRSLVSSIPANTEFKVSYIRDGKTYTTSVKTAAKVNGQTAQNSGSAEQFAIFNTKFGNKDGLVVVQDINEKSIFAQYGILKGDVLVAVQDQQVKSVEQLAKVIDDLKDADGLIFQFRRGTRTIYVTLAHQ